MTIYGASSFVGKIIVTISTRLGVNKDVRWAIAGRNMDKLQSVKDSLGKSAEELDIVVANSDDLGSLRQMVSKCQLVLSTVGPCALR